MANFGQFEQCLNETQQPVINMNTIKEANGPSRRGRKRSRVHSDGEPANKRRQTACHMNTIGDDCLGLLLSFLPVRGISRFRVVSRGFRDICGGALLRIDKISTTDIPGNNFVDVTCFNCYNIRELVVTRPLSLKEIQTLVQKCQRIERVYLRFDGRIRCAEDYTQPKGFHCEDFVLTYLGTHLPNLKLVAFGGCVNPDDLVNFSKLCTTLEEFQFVLTEFCGDKDVLVKALHALQPKVGNENWILDVGTSITTFGWWRKRS